MMMGYRGFVGMNWIGMILGSIISIVVLIGLVLLVVWAVRRMSGSTPRPGAQAPAGQAPTGQAARDIAQVRYAKGEITKEQFEQIKKDLT